MTIRDLFLAIVILVTLVLGIAIQGGAWGPSDLELWKRAAGL